MGIIWMLIAGLVAGLAARAIVPGRDAMSLPATVVLGVVGSFLGGTVWALISGDGFDLSAGNIILAIIGAIIALLIYRQVKARASA